MADNRPRPPTHREPDDHRIFFDPAVMTLLKNIATGLTQQRTQLTRMEAGFMAMKQDFETLRVAVNDATNKIGARIQALIDKQAAGGMTAAEEDEVKAGLDAELARLQALGADPVDPVPVERNR